MVPRQYHHRDGFARRLMSEKMGEKSDTKTSFSYCLDNNTIACFLFYDVGRINRRIKVPTVWSNYG
jgi:hypothetical protein